MASIPAVEAMLHRACEAARERDLLGPATGFDVSIVRGAGAYICGEETAIFNSIEGYRGEPRNKPPYPFEVGLFGQPTVVNNVETLMNVPAIVLGRTSSNRRVFCLSGAVAVPGVYEVELGLTLGELIALAGGVRAGSQVQAVLLGGAAGRFVGPDAMGLVLDHDSVTAAGLSLGSGVVMVHDQHVDLIDQVRRIAAFFRSESCGQCVPCRVGTVRQQEVIDRIVGGADEFALLADIGRAMTDASICGLGQTAYHAVESRGRTSDIFHNGEQTPMTEISLTIDDRHVSVPEGTTILQAWWRRRRRARDSDAVLQRHDHSQERMPALCRRGRGVAGARTGLLALGRTRHGRAHAVRARRPRSPDGARVPRILGRPVTHPERDRMERNVRGRSRALRSVGRDGRPTGQGGQRALCQGLLEVHPVLPVRRCVRVAMAEQLRHRDRRPGIRRTGVDRARGRTSRLGLCLLRQLHPGVSDGRTPSDHRVRDARPGTWDEDRQTETETVCGYCGVGCGLTLHVQDETIVKVTSPIDNAITHGNLCIKGRFGFEHAQNLPDDRRPGDPPPSP